MADDVMRLLALWMLTHEAADEEMKAAIRRGQAGGAEGMTAGPAAFVDGLSALVEEEKERLKRELAERAAGRATPPEDTATLGDMRFEIAEVRARLEAIEARLDVLTRMLER